MCKPLLILFLFCGLFSFRAARSQQVTLNRDQALLQELFLEIHQQTGYFFYYANNDLDEAKPVTIHVNKAPLEEVLGICFSGQPLIYRIDNKTIVVQKKPFVPASLIDLKGKVQTEQGEPLEDVSVELAGTHKVVSTGSGGEFSLDKVNENAVLNFSHVGYEPRSVTLNKSQYLTVILKRSVSKLDEVQVIAYGTTTRRLNTGNVSTVNAETISKQPVSNVLSAMEGRVPGMYIQQNTGTPGGSFSIKIRGRNSIRPDGNDPLFIVDGIPYPSVTLSSDLANSIIPDASPLNSLNPEDIESIDVLKDADATAIYGSKGANGVILINTKKGKSGKTKFALNLNSGAGKITHMMNLLNTSQYLEMRKEAFVNDGAVPDPDYDYDLTRWDPSRNTDWQKELIGNTAHVLNAEGTITGGDLHTQFLISESINKETTVFPGDFADMRSATHFNISHSSSNSRFKLTLTGSYSIDKNNLFNTDLASSAIILPPNMPDLTDADGNIVFQDYFTNPYIYLKRKFKALTYNLISNALLSYQIIPGLEIKTSFGYNKIDRTETQLKPKSTYRPTSTTPASSSFANNGIESWIFEPQLDYSKKWGNHHFSVLIGSTFQQDLKQGQTITGSGYSNDALLENIQAANVVQINSSNYSQYRYTAVFTRVGYNYSDKYLLNITARRDGSSRFAPDKRFSDFGAVGAGWIFTNESFLKRRKFLSFGKLRASYGVTGNDQIGDYMYLDLWATTYYPYQGVAGINPVGIPTTDYAWERVKKLEFGLQLGFLTDKILISASQYRNRSDNQLVGYFLPPSTGFQYITSNLPALVQNTGWEFELNADVLKSRHFNWSLSFNLTLPSNKLIRFPNLESSAYANSYTVGKPLSIQKLFHYTGVSPATGLYTFEDVNKDGDISYPSDLQSIKVLDQKYYGGLLNSFRFKGWQCDFFIQFVNQTGSNLVALFSMPGFQTNQEALVMERWEKSGDNSGIQKFSQAYGDAYHAHSKYSPGSDEVITDASFIRLKNISLSYQLPERWLKRTHLAEAKIFAMGQNLWTKTNYMGLDPESQGSVIPPLKMLSAGLQLIL